MSYRSVGIHALAVIALVCTSHGAHAAPIHSYELDGDAVDSEGSADGVVGANVVFDSSAVQICLDQAAVFGSGGGAAEEISIPMAGFTGFGTGDFTIEFWVRRDDMDGGNDGFIDALSGSSTGWSLRFNSDDTVYGRFDDDLGNSIVIESISTITDTGWHHIAYTMDRDSATGLKIYIDGVEDNSTDPTAVIGNIDPSQDVQIGASNGTNGLEGALARVRFRNDRRTAEQVSDLAAAPPDFDLDGISDECEPALAVMYVDADADGASDGSGWTDAHRTLQTALTIAGANPGVVTEIRVAQGTYFPDGGYTDDSGVQVFGDGDRERTHQLANGVAVIGGYAGGGEPDPDLRDPEAHPTILSGNINGGGLGGNSYSVILADGAGVSASIDGLTITEGNADDSEGRGGGLLCLNSASVAITDCAFLSNSADMFGGAISANFAGQLIVTGSRFIGNSSLRGGAIADIGNSGGTVITDCLFLQNAAAISGGAAYFGTPISAQIFERCVMLENTAASGSAIYGAGLANDMTFVNCLSAGNTPSATAAFDTNFSGAASMLMTNCTIIEDTATNAITISSSTNSAPTLKLRNCIVREHTMSAIDLQDNAVADVEYCNIEGGFTGTGNIGNDPLFLDPDGPDNDPATYSDNDYRLSEFSKSCDAGDNTADGLLGVFTDLDGADRFLYNPFALDTGVGLGAIVDLGAYETEGCDNAGPDLDLNGIPDDCELPPIMYVDADADGSGDGRSWTNASRDLDLILFLASNHPMAVEEIRVAQGTYFPDGGYTDDSGIQTAGDLNRNSAFFLVEGALLQGGYAGDGEPDPDLLDHLAHPTTLSGNINGGGSGGNSYTVVRAREVDNTTMMAGFTVRDGNANSNTGEARRKGGGMYIQDNASPMIADCIFRENHSLQEGGGVSVSESAPSFFDCDFILNTCDGDGGGISLDDGSSPSRLVVFSGCRFHENSSDDNGGGVYGSLWYEVEFYDCEFLKNNSGTGGGAMLNSERAEFRRCSFIENEASSVGAARMRTIPSFGAGVVESSTFVGNKADRWPGIQYLFDLHVTNSTFVDNTSITAHDDDSPLYTNADVYSLIVSNSVFIGNGSPLISAPVGASVAVDYCNVEGGHAGTGNIDANPRFEDPDGADDDPLTYDDNDYRLGNASPCIDAGDNTAQDLAGTGGDLDLAPRFADDTGTPDTGVGPGPVVDMGAYEFQGTSILCPGDINGDGVVDTADLGVLISQFGQSVGGPTADLNNDGMVDTADLGILIGAFGSTCP